MKFKYSKQMEWLRLINNDLAVRTGLGQARNQDTGKHIGDVAHYCRARFAYPNRVENVHITFNDAPSAKLAQQILLERMRDLANSGTGTNERYNQLIRDFVEELKNENSGIQEYIKGTAEQLVVAPSKGEKDQ